SSLRRTDALRLCPLRRPGFLLQGRCGMMTASLVGHSRPKSGRAAIMSSEAPGTGRSVEPQRGCARRSGSFLPTGLGVGLVVLLGFLTVLYSLQDRIIFPGAGTQGTPDSLVRPRPGTELLTLTTPRGQRIVALFGPALLPDGRPHPDPGSRPAL